MSIIDEYLNRLNPVQKSALQQVRDIIQQAAPDAKEVISYGMPGFKYKGKYLITFGAFKDHLSLFPGAESVATFQEELKGFKVSKGTIQFTPDRPVPETLLKEMIAQRLASITKSISS